MVTKVHTSLLREGLYLNLKRIMFFSQVSERESSVVYYRAGLKELANCTLMRTDHYTAARVLELI